MCLHFVNIEYRQESYDVNTEQFKMFQILTKQTFEFSSINTMLSAEKFLKIVFEQQIIRIM